VLQTVKSLWMFTFHLLVGKSRELSYYNVVLYKSCFIVSWQHVYRLLLAAVASKFVQLITDVT
jgi:hypothetical protein